MLFTRRLGKILRGRSTPFQIALSGLLAGALAFQPGFAHAPGIVTALIVLLVILNGSLPFAFAVWGPLKLVSYALMGTSFAIGRFLIDGPTRGLWTWLVNAPVFAWFGFENYVASGGLVLGSVLGLIAGALAAKLLIGMRQKLAGLEEGSERYKQFVAKPWAKVLLFVFVGGSRGKQSWSELAAKRIGNPVRITGAVVAVLLVAAVWFLQKQFATPILTRELRSTLEVMNGATVDLGKAELLLEQGRMTISDLALADPDALDRDLFRTAALEADASTEDFLMKRVRVESLLSRAASSGEMRATPGERIGAPEEPPPPPEAGPGEKTLEEWLADYEKWRDRLKKAREWMEKLSKREDSGDAPETEEEREETLRDRLERLAREHGWATVRATHLIEGAPALLVSKTAVEEFTIASIPGEVFDVRLNDLSTNPELAPRSPSFELASKSGKIRIAVDLNASSPQSATNGLGLTWKGIPAADIVSQLRTQGAPVLQGGTVDIEMAGGWSEGRVGYIDLPLRVTVHDSTLNLGDLGSAPVKTFALPIHLRGPLDALRVKIDGDELSRSLQEAGAAELERRLRDEVEKLEDEAKDRLEDVLDDETDEAKKTFEEQVGEEAKGLIDGLLGGKKKKDGG